MPPSSTATDWSRLHADYVGAGVPSPVACTAALPLTPQDHGRLAALAHTAGASRDVLLLAMLGTFVARYLGAPIRVLGQLPASSGRAREAALDLDLEAVSSLVALSAHCLRSLQSARDTTRTAGMLLRVHEPTDQIEREPSRLDARDLDVAVSCTPEALLLTVVFDAELMPGQQRRQRR